MDFRLNRDERGAVYVEFLVVILPLLTFFLCLIQLALVFSAGILTQVAAAKAVRAAVVVLGDDHEDAKYGEPLHQVGTGGDGIDAYRNAPKNSRYESIRKAARYPLAAVSPSFSQYSAPSIERAITFTTIDAAISLAGWTRYAVGLGFVTSSDEYQSRFEARGDVRVKVIFLFPCFVPVGRDLICRSYGALSEEARTLLEVNGQVVGWTRFLSWRFVTLSAAATLPNQGRR